MSSADAGDNPVIDAGPLASPAAAVATPVFIHASSSEAELDGFWQQSNSAGQLTSPPPAPAFPPQRTDHVPQHGHLKCQSVTHSLHTSITSLNPGCFVESYRRLRVKGDCGKWEGSCYVTPIYREFIAQARMHRNVQVNARALLTLFASLDFLEVCVFASVLKGE